MTDLILVIFGVTSNLASKKLIPAIFSLFEKGLLPKRVKIVGMANRVRSDEEMKKIFYDSIVAKYGLSKNEAFDKFWVTTSFVFGDFSGSVIYSELKKQLSGDGRVDIIYYLATFPELYQGIFEKLNESGLDKNELGMLKLLIEKPIGNDELSAKRLNQLLDKYFEEDQIFRIDHYLAKETVQNILSFRFQNPIVESIMDSTKIDHVQITSGEDFGAEFRNAYYDSVGALKDVGQNHVLQMLAFSLMNQPKSLDHDGIVRSREEVFENLVPNPNSLVLGQYEGYSEEESETNTFFAFKTELRSGIMEGIPIYVRGGKKLGKTVSEVSFIFKNRAGKVPNVLIFRVQPNEGIVIEMAVKKPGFEMECQPGSMQFCYRHLNEAMVEAYERLIVDAIKGQRTFFNGAKEVELQWKFIDGLKSEKNKVVKYQGGSWGPKEAFEMIESDGRYWLEPSENVCRV